MVARSKTVLLAGLAVLIAGCQSSYPNATPEVLTSAQSSQLHDATLRETLETMPDRTSLHWDDPDSDAEGYAVPLGTYRMADGTYCRDYYTRATAAGTSVLTQGYACRMEDGRWVVDRRL